MFAGLQSLSVDFTACPGGSGGGFADESATLVLVDQAELLTFVKVPPMSSLLLTSPILLLLGVEI